MTTHSDPLGCGDCPVRDLAICSGLEEQERLALARLGLKRHYRRGELIFASGDESVACATLVAGAVKLSRCDRDGVERTIALLQPSSMLARLFAADIDSDAVALTDSELCVFPRSLVESEMRSHPGFMERILQATTAQLASARDMLDLVGRRSARAKVAGLLLVLADEVDTASPSANREFVLPLTRGEMATLLGLTIETVSRQLTGFERDGTIERRGLKSIAILNPSALRAAAD
ncbi:Crp/Fnr family transcriptional regulator [Sphingomonas sp. GlSt437]|uniref:Crp/Fnr family transcriptional regulator n=1 Tax=Sphingomonas sp. GlSt437 TaxID=3389970 RepID=UPI003A8A1C03